MTLVATGLGSMPGSDAAAYTEAVRIVWGELPDLPHVPELPGRGATATMTGRGVAVLAELGADLQPAGWRLTDAAGVDQRRARSLLAQDLDTVEELADGYVGALKVQLIGPWTMAATVEKPRGDKVLADHGARRDLAQALAAGLGDHVAALGRRLPGVDRVVVQLDEPALPAVLAAKVPTASGFGRHRSVEPPVAAAALGWCFDGARAAGADEVIVHCCAADAPMPLLRESGADGVAVDVALLDAAGLDALAAAIEAGDRVLLGVLPTSETLPGGVLPTERDLTERVERLFDLLGLAPTDRLVLTPGCGLASAAPGSVVPALSLLRGVGSRF